MFSTFFTNFQSLHWILLVRFLLEATPLLPMSALLILPAIGNFDKVRPLLFMEGVVVILFLFGASVCVYFQFCALEKIS